MENEEIKNVEFESWQISGIMRFVQNLPYILDKERDGTPSKKYTKKDILNVVKFLTKFDKRRWLDYLNKKFFIQVDKEGRPCCRTVVHYQVVHNDYLENRGDKDEGNK